MHVRLFFFDLACFDECLLLGLNLLIQFLAGAFFGALFHQFALNGHLQEGFLHIAGKTLVELFQLCPRFFVAVDQRQQLLNLGNNALLLGKWWDWQYICPKLVQTCPNPRDSLHFAIHLVLEHL